MEKDDWISWTMNYEQFLIIHSALSFYDNYCPQSSVQYLIEKMEDLIKKSYEEEFEQ